MTLLARLKSAALAGRELLAAIGAQVSVANVTLGPATVTIVPKATPQQAPTEAPAKCAPGACARPGRCIVCGLRLPPR